MTKLLQGGERPLEKLKLGKLYVIPLLPPRGKRLPRKPLVWHIAQYDFADVMASSACMFWYYPTFDYAKQNDLHHRQVKPKLFKRPFQGLYIREATRAEIKAREHEVRADAAKKHNR